jgi:hypothetical protein
VLEKPLEYIRSNAERPGRNSGCASYFLKYGDPGSGDPERVALRIIVSGRGLMIHDEYSVSVGNAEIWIQQQRKPLKNHGGTRRASASID